MRLRENRLWTATRRWYCRHQLAVFRLITAPGIICHEVAHALACAMFGLRIERVELLQLSGPAGYVTHEQPHTWLQSVGVSSAPAVFNGVIGLGILQLIIGVYHGGGLTAGVIVTVSVWVSMTALIHALPSVQDLQTLWNTTTRRWYRLPAGVVVYPLFRLRGGIRVVGVYQLTIPFAIALGIGMFSVHDVSHAEFGESVRAGCWGCWETPLVAQQLFEWGFGKCEAVVEMAIESLSE